MMATLAEMISVMLLCLSLQSGVIRGAPIYPLDDSVGLGRRFDGIGGLSGGGVSCHRLSASMVRQTMNLRKHTCYKNFCFDFDDMMSMKFLCTLL